MTVACDQRLFFDPQGQKPPVFFLHIPKTAGSSNNHFLRGLYGAHNFQDHAENLLPDLTTGRAGVLRVDCVSGHIPLWAWHLYPGAERYKRVTLLRDPWARLVSHVNWVNQFNHGMRLPRHGPGAGALAHMVGVIADTDFENRTSLGHLFEQANALQYFSSFDNYQTRMLRQGAMDAMEKRLTMADLDVACTALSGFYHFGFCEDQAGFQQGLLRKLSLPATPQKIQANQARTKVLTPDNDIAHQVFAPWLEYDQALVGFARGLMRGGGMQRSGYNARQPMSRR